MNYITKAPHFTLRSVLNPNQCDNYNNFKTEIELQRRIYRRWEKNSVGGSFVKHVNT